MIGAYSSPLTVFIGFVSGSFGDYNVCMGLFGNGYARQLVAFDAAVSGTADNTGAIEFSAATASWGTVSHFGLFDASTGGNLLIHGVFAVPKLIDSGDILKIAAGKLDITAA